MKKIILIVSAVVSLLFGMITVITSGFVWFDLFGVREQQGNFVPFVVMGNFLIGFFYLWIAYGFFTAKQWTQPLLFAVISALVVLFSAFMLHVFFGGIYETKTIYAFIFRIALTSLLAAVSWFTVRDKSVSGS
jgi:hypothetical protein